MADAKQSQQALEHVDAPLAATRASQEALEVVHETPPSGPLRETQAAAEVVQYPPNAIIQTQLCLEVLFPAYTPPAPTSRKNHTFWAGWWATGHGDNAGFEG